MDLNNLLEKTVIGLGYELVDVEFAARGLLRVFIDRPEKANGVDVEDCATVSRQLSRLLDVENVDYDRLEVSSPGLDRPLKKAADFERFVGEEVRLSLRTPLSGQQRNYRGRLLGLRDGKVVLQVESGKAADELAVDLENIAKARLAPSFGGSRAGADNRRSGDES
ncbi:MAG: ribosome maturation factor RimP [Zoogloeaceae bacterium]|jgi:ribosome maturation factor RimP|nr:ribosome maturation factor RimP [Zoogloeaceae bacterium]